MLKKFKHGLSQRIALYIMYCNTPPVTLTNWQNAMRAKIVRQAQILVNLEPDPQQQLQGGGHFQPQRRPMQYSPPRGPPPPHTNRPTQLGPVPMDVDAACLGESLTDDE